MGIGVQHVYGMYYHCTQALKLYVSADHQRKRTACRMRLGWAGSSHDSAHLLFPSEFI